MRIKPIMFLPVVVVLGFVVLAVVANQRNPEEANQLPTALAGKPAPAVQLTKLGNLPEFDDAVLRNGQVKLVNFWASWCAPCRVEHPNLKKVAAEEGVKIYGVNYKDKPDNALKFLDDLGNPYAAVGADPKGQMGLNWGQYGVPETFVIDGKGNIVTRFAGPITQDVVKTVIGPAIASARAGKS